MTLLPVVRMVPVSVPLSVPAPVALLKVITVLPVGLDVLPLASCDCTVTLNAVPATPVLGTAVNASFVAAPAENTMLPLVTGVKLVMPAVALAVNVIVSAFE